MQLHVKIDLHSAKRYPTVDQVSQHLRSHKLSRTPEPVFSGSRHHDQLNAFTCYHDHSARLAHFRRSTCDGGRAAAQTTPTTVFLAVLFVPPLYCVPVATPSHKETWSFSEKRAERTHTRRHTHPCTAHTQTPFNPFKQTHLGTHVHTRL